MSKFVAFLKHSLSKNKLKNVLRVFVLSSIIYFFVFAKGLLRICCLYLRQTRKEHTMGVNRKKQMLVFSVTWTVYASAYLLRKPLGVVRNLLFSLCK